MGWRHIACRTQHTRASNSAPNCAPLTEATIAGFVADTDAAIEKTLASSSLEPDAQNTLRPALQTHHRDRIKWGLNEMSRSREQ